jgi:uridine kinase
MTRDIQERGRTVEGVLKSYHRFVKPAFSEFVRPTLKYADIIVPRARQKNEQDNEIAIDFIVHNLEHKLTQRGFKIEHLNSLENKQPVTVSCYDKLAAHLDCKVYVAAEHD